MPMSNLQLGPAGLQDESHIGSTMQSRKGCMADTVHNKVEQRVVCAATTGSVDSKPLINAHAATRAVEQSSLNTSCDGKHKLHGNHRAHQVTTSDFKGVKSNTQA